MEQVKTLEALEIDDLNTYTRAVNEIVSQPLVTQKTPYERLEELEHTFPDTNQDIADYIFASKYARYLEDEKRRETWDEAVDRVKDMHVRRFYEDLDEEAKAEFDWAFEMIRQKKIVPSMRAMQFGGAAVEAHNARMFNCAVRHMDSIRSFAEVFYLLLCGCGVGIGLTDKYLSRLPDLVTAENKTGIVITYQVEDSIEGWADAIEALLNCYFVNTAYTGRKIVFDFSRIRPAGSPLKTGGGKAPGHEGLKQALSRIKTLLDRIIEEEGVTRLRTVDAYDISMHTADAVLSGGVRRSAMSVIFDKNDELMLNAKVGNWFDENPQRARSNNSVLLLRSETTEDELSAIMDRTREWGEPGFVFGDTEDVLYNPCFEVSFVPVTDDGVCGVQFCNLTSVNGSQVQSDQDLYDAVKAAAIVGVLQKAYTDFKYLSHVAKQLTDDEALLGVSMTAMMDNPRVMFNEVVQRKAAEEVVATDLRWSRIIGVKQAARTNVIKPEGTSTIVLKSMASGIHAAHSRFMLRRVQANKLDNVYRFFKSLNPHATEESLWSAAKTDDVITFPIVNPKGAQFKKDLTALSHLDLIKRTQRNWVVPGTTPVNKKPIHHNVSCTVVMKEDEWEPVTKYLFKNRNYFAAVSFLADDGDNVYAQAPMQDIKTHEDVDKFIELMNNWIPVNYEWMTESTDETSLLQEAACAGGACEVR
jgi:ribonucleoside-triphosphate reductase